MSNETILIVDDNHQITDFLGIELLPGFGYQSLVAHDGKRALELVREHRPDLMLLDFQLSDTTGLKVLRQLASEGLSMPAILMTAEGSEQVAVEAFRLGVQDYLIKPIDADSLCAAITRALTETRLHREKAKLTAQLKQQVTWLTVLSKVGQSVTSILELNQVLTRIVEAGVYLTHAEEGFLALLDGQDGQLFLRAVKNIDQDEIRTLRLRVSDPLVGRVINTGSPVRMTRGVKGDPLKVSTGLLVHSLLYVPILSKEEVLGVLSVDNRFNERPFTETDEKLLTSLAGYAAVAIENAQLYEHAQQEIIERARAEEQINASLREKEVLLKEIHHRVKNNLQVISSLLNLQSDYVGDQQALKVLQDSQHRIRSMALIHEKLYQPQDLGRIDLAEYIRDLAAYLFRSYNAGARSITWSIEADDVFLGIDSALPSGLILNELISNSLKHAFSPDMDKPGDWVDKICVELVINDGHMMTLIVADNGTGLPADLDFRNTTSLGLQLVNTLVNQLDGTIELVECGEGTTFKITFAAI